jgi:hypothetical protein
MEMEEDRKEARMYWLDSDELRRILHELAVWSNVMDGHGGLCGADRTRRVDEGGSVVTNFDTAAEEVTESDDGYNEDEESIAFCLDSGRLG